MNYPKLSCSITNTFSHKIEDFSNFIKNSNSMLHLDVMDGIFVENSFLNRESELIKFKNTGLNLDIHLMIKNPQNTISKYIELKPKIITYHTYSIDDNYEKYELLDTIKNHKILSGIAISPEFEIENFFDIIPDCDLVLIMSVKPGKGGQKFMPEVLKKVEKLKNFIIKNNLKTKIHIDGGINSENYKTIKNHQVDTCIVGSDIFKSENIDYVRKKIEFFSI